MMGRSWWDEKLREVRQSSPYKQTESELEKQRPNKHAHRRDRKRNSSPSLSIEVSSDVGSVARHPSKSGRVSPAKRRANQNGDKHGKQSDGSVVWDQEKIKRDSTAWQDMLESTSRDQPTLEDDTGDSDGDMSCGGQDPGQKEHEKQHVCILLSKLLTVWASLRKVISTQASMAGIFTSIEDLGIGFDDFVAAVEQVGVLATRMQLQAIFSAVDVDCCEIITLAELGSFMRREGFSMSSVRVKKVHRETEKARKALSEIFDHVVEVMICWDLHGNNALSLIDISRGLRFLNIPGLDVNQVIAEAAADCTLTDSVVRLKEFVRHFCWHAVEPLPVLVARYDKTKLQRALVMAKVRAWKAREQELTDPELVGVYSKLRSKWGAIKAQLKAMQGLSRAGRSRGGGGNHGQPTLSLTMWREGVEASGLQLTDKQIERVFAHVQGQNQGQAKTARAGPNSHVCEDQGVTLEDLDRAVKVASEVRLSNAADRAQAESSGEKWMMTAPVKSKPGQQSARLRRLFSRIWESPVHAFCFLAMEPCGSRTGLVEMGLGRRGTTG